MTIAGRILAIALAIVCAAGTAPAKNRSDWTKVEALDTGARVWVETKAGTRYAGRIAYVDTQSMSLYLDVDYGTPPSVVVRRDDVRRVKKYLPRVVSALIGAGIGIGIGVAAGAAADTRCHGCDDPGVMTVVGGGAGVALGSAIGSGVKIKGPTLYEAP